MKTSYINFFASLAVAAMGLTTTSCDLDCINPNGPDASTFFISEDRFILNMIAIHAEWRSDFDVLTFRSAGELRSGIYTITGIDGSALNDLTYVENALDASHTQFSNFAGFYGTIANVNNFIEEAENSSVFNSDETKNYLLGMAYGMRSYCYFQLYKMYGTVPMRLSNEVFQGVYNANELFRPRAAASEVLAQIKSDITKSSQYFASGKITDARIAGSKYYWNEAATNMLGGEVYLWSAKVATGNQAAVPGDITTAKTYFEKVIGAGYAMQSNYPDVFDVTKKTSNKEVIFATYYSYGVATNNWYWYSLWNSNTGTGQGTWWIQTGEDGLTPIEGANRLGRYVNAAGNMVNNEFWYTQGQVVNRYEYKNTVYYQFDKEDSRRDYMLQACYIPFEDEEDTNYIADFDPEKYYLAGTFVYKYRGEFQNNRNVGTNDGIYYRLPLAYMYLAEIANYENNKNDVEKYINIIRKRAYGDNFEGHEYKAGDFLDNEVAILQEKTKEFLQEGQRWWDLRRLTAVKGGDAKDHLIFRPEGCAGWGLDPSAHPFWCEVSNNLGMAKDNKIETNVPVLDYNVKAHMVLWPIPASAVIEKGSNKEYPDQEFTQTPGY